MKKYKIYSKNKNYNLNEKILFLNVCKDEELSIFEKYSNATILYNSKEIFLNNLDKITEYISKKLDIITFDYDIKMIINKIKKKKKKQIGILSDSKNHKSITELEKIYDIDYSSDPEHFLKKNITLCIIDLKNTPDYNNLLEHRYCIHNYKTIIIDSNSEIVLYQFFINYFWDESIKFIKIYNNLYFSNQLTNEFSDSIIELFNIKKIEYNINEPLIYFGNLSENDYEKIMNHKNIIFFIWIYSIKDDNNLKDKILNLKNKHNIYHFSINNLLIKDLEKYEIYANLFPIEINIKKIFKEKEIILNVSDYIIFRQQNTINFSKGNHYILQFEGCKITDNLEYGIQFIEGMNDKEIIIYYYAENDLEIDEIEFIKMQKIHNKICGYNSTYLKNIDVEYLYYIYGKMKNDNILTSIGLSNIFNYYNTDILHKKFNVELLKRKWCYDLGKKDQDLNISEFCNFIIKYSNNIITDKCIFFSKKINGFGGNQKTALQVIELLEKYFIIDVFSSNIFNNFDLIKDSLDCRIHNMKIIKNSNDKIIEEINNNKYCFIINNKFNEYFKIFNNVIHPRLYIITHNSMDPFNRLIIKNQNNIKKVLTINKFHQNILVKHGLKIPTGIYYNTVDEEKSITKRDKFKNRICFIGRFSKEKNLELLIESINQINNIELVIIGGENEKGYTNKNIIWKGILDKNKIIEELKECDYLIVPSSSEGLPFVILEAMNIGIPCIYSNIIGADELIERNGERGFLFDLVGYKKCMMNINWEVFKEVNKNFKQNIKNINDCIKRAYSISITEWNIMSEKCINFVKNKYLLKETDKKNLDSFEIIL